MSFDIWYLTSIIYITEFEVDGVAVEEPDNGKILSTDITIVRTGGTLGVVSIDWAALLNGKLLSNRWIHEERKVI